MKDAGFPPPFPETAMDIEAFALRVLAQLGGRLDRTPLGVRVELESQALGELEGRPLWPAVAPGPDHRTVVYLTFAPEASAQDSRYELVTAGSARLDQLAAQALRRGRLGRAWARLAGVRPVVYRPYLLFHFLLTYIGHEPRMGFLTVAADLVGADACPWPTRTFPVRVDPPGDGTPMQTPRLSLGEAHQAAVAALARVLRERDAVWLRAARLWLERELEALHTYCKAALAEDGRPETDGAPAIRRAELEALARPHVRARAEAATLLYMPLVRRGTDAPRLYNPLLDRPAP